MPCFGVVIVGLNFEFLLALNHDDVTPYYPKREISGKGFHSKTHSFGESNSNYRYFVVENHKFCFDIP
jgi:hypothetical protein